MRAGLLNCQFVVIVSPLVAIMKDQVSQEMSALFI